MKQGESARARGNRAGARHRSVLRGEASREAILVAAIRVVGRDGLPAASLGAIAKEAGTSKPAVLYHYGSRENLLREMAQRALTGFVSRIIEASRLRIADAGARHGLEVVFSEEMRTDVAAARELMSLGMRDAVVGETVRKSIDEVERAVALLLENSVNDPQQVADDVVRSMLGFVEMWLCTSAADPAPFRDGAMRVLAALLRGDAAPTGGD
jgi:AcrR family transcriptional regulator